MSIDGSRNLLIAGGSVRAAAASAIRAGFTPWCVDCFGDADLVREFPTRVIRDYPKEFPELLASAPPGPWMYTGALENHPEIIAAVDRPLYGNPADVVRGVRSHIDVCCSLKVPDQPFGTRSDEIFLFKSCKGGGGIGIEFWEAQSLDDDHYIQPWIEGVSMSLVFLADENRCECVGSSRQLVGVDWLHAPYMFHYCGSIFQLPPKPSPLGEEFASHYGMRGLFGIDGVLQENRPFWHDDTFWKVEVNPRYTASIEIVERATGRRLLAEHAGVFGDSRIESAPRSSETTETSRHPGKAILYAPIDFTFPAAGPWDDDHPFADLRRRFADLPHPGQAIRRGQPVLTFFADGDSPTSTEAALRKIAGDLDRLLFGR